MATTKFFEKMDTFTNNLNGRLSAASSVNPVHPNTTETNKILGLEHEDEAFVTEYQRTINSEDLPHIEDESDVLFQGVNMYIDMELGLPRNGDGSLGHATVKRSAIGVEGKTMGTDHNKTIYDNRQYEVEFLNGDTEILTANIIAENILSQVGEEGHRQMMLDEIIDHRVLKDAIPKSEETYKTQFVTIRDVGTTKG